MKCVPGTQHLQAASRMREPSWSDLVQPKPYRFTWCQAYLLSVLGISWKTLSDSSQALPGAQLFSLLEFSHLARPRSLQSDPKTPSTSLLVVWDLLCLQTTWPQLPQAGLLVLGSLYVHLLCVQMPWLGTRVFWKKNQQGHSEGTKL